MATRLTEVTSFKDLIEYRRSYLEEQCPIDKIPDCELDAMAFDRAVNVIWERWEPASFEGKKKMLEWEMEKKAVIRQGCFHVCGFNIARKYDPKLTAMFKDKEMWSTILLLGISLGVGGVGAAILHFTVKWCVEHDSRRRK